MKPTLGFFFELNGSLELWDSVGFLHREIALYNRFAKEYFGKIYFFTYGDVSDLHYKNLLESNIEIVPLRKKPASFLLAFFYELAIPLIHYKKIKDCNILKTNQNSGSLAASISKILFPKKRLIIRSGYIGSELSRLSRLPIYVRLYYFFEESISYRLCNHALIPTDENARLLVKKYHCLKKKLSIHNNFIDTEKFNKTDVDTQLFDIIYVGRMNQDKNHQAILRASEGLNLSILFIGDGEEKDPILSLAEKLHINLKHIASIPNDELPRYYNAAKICVFPSLHEGNPKALLEAMSCELPVIGFDVPGVGNIIKNEENGIISDEKNLKESIKNLLSNEELRKRIGIEARRTIIKEFSIDDIVSKEISIYNKLVKNNI
jgi:glycosyltransferase involved in cell wall biosynthesis